MRKPTMGTAGETYRGPLEESAAPRVAEIPAALLPSRQVFFGRDDDGALCQYPSRPKWVGKAFEPGQPRQIGVLMPEEWFQHLEGGQCQAFVAHGPRIDCKREAGD